MGAKSSDGYGRTYYVEDTRDWAYVRDSFKLTDEELNNKIQTFLKSDVEIIKSSIIKQFTHAVYKEREFIGKNYFYDILKLNNVLKYELQERLYQRQLAIDLLKIDVYVDENYLFDNVEMKINKNHGGLVKIDDYVALYRYRTDYDTFIEYVDVYDLKNNYLYTFTKEEEESVHCY